MQYCLLSTELDGGGFQGYAGFPGDIPMDQMDGNMMHEDYVGTMQYDRQAYHEPY